MKVTKLGRKKLASRRKRILTHSSDIFPVLTHPAIGGMVRSCCHAAIAVLERLGASMGIQVEPLPVSVEVLNGVAARHYLRTGEVLRELPASKQAELGQQGARYIHVPYEKLEGERLDTGGHLVALVPSLGLLIDPTVEQFSFPDRMRIHLREPVVKSVTATEVRSSNRRSPIKVRTGDLLILYHHEPRMRFWQDSPLSDYNNRELIDSLEALVRRYYGEGRNIPPLPPALETLAQLETMTRFGSRS